MEKLYADHLEALKADFLSVPKDSGMEEIQTKNESESFLSRDSGGWVYASIYFHANVV